VRLDASRWALRPLSRHNRPISAGFPARAEVAFREAPMTLLSHCGGPNARAPRAPPRLLQATVTRRSFERKGKCCSVSLPAKSSLTTLAGNLRQPGSYYSSIRTNAQAPRLSAAWRSRDTFGEMMGPFPQRDFVGPLTATRWSGRLASSGAPPTST
jgi:hypothetical protein